MKYTLLSDGSSDRALMPFLTWLLEEHLPESPIQGQWADFRHLNVPPARLRERILAAIDLYPCDLLFIHRDAERMLHGDREMEIRGIVAEIGGTIPVVCVIPVRMQEAWLLVDEVAIRAAAGNPRGRVQLNLPPLRQLEDLADPKATLYNLLRIASEQKGRRLAKLPVRALRYRVAELISDRTVNRRLPAFAALEEGVRRVVHQWQ